MRYNGNESIYYPFKWPFNPNNDDPPREGQRANGRRTYLCCSQAVGWAREEKYFDQELPFILSGKLIKRALRVLKCSENKLKQPLKHSFSSFYSECGFLVTRLGSL